jgi:ABC-2 type transport system ATP-binding protein
MTTTAMQERDRLHKRASTATEPVIQVQDLKKSYGDGITAVDDVSFEIDRGRIVGLLGPNGAGKTTTIKSMLGLIVPDRGTVSVCGIDVADDPRQAHSHIGAMLEGDRNVYWRLTVRENLEYFAGLGGQRPGDVRERHEELLERFDLVEWADTPVNELSTGMKQKVSLASTLARDVDVIFLDEPTLGLDVETAQDLRQELGRLVAEENVTIVLTSHDLDTIEAVCDRVIILQDGAVLADEETDTLVDLFQTQAYRFVVDEQLSEQTRQLLVEEFDASIDRNNDGTVIQCVSIDSDGVYQLMASLSAEEQTLREVESIDPGLEDIFLDIVDGDETFGSDDSDSGGEN